MSHANLWAPWRMEYLRTLDGSGGGGEAPACFLCEAVERAVDPASMRERLVLRNEPRGLLMLNRYPYTNGHLLVAAREHIGDLADLTAEQRAGLMELTVLGQQTLRLAMNPQGFNVGINQGRCAGAGVPGHLHLHVVPRWGGDVNFMEIVGTVRVIPQALEQTYDLLRAALGQAAAS